MNKLFTGLRNITNKIGDWAKNGYNDFKTTNKEISAQADTFRLEQGKAARNRSGKGIGVVADYANVVSNAFKSVISDIKANNYQLQGMDNYVNALHERDGVQTKTSEYYAKYADNVLRDAEKVTGKSAAEKFLDTIEDTPETTVSDRSFA